MFAIHTMKINIMLHHDILPMIMNVNPANYSNLGRHLKFRRVCKTWNRASQKWVCVYTDNMKKCANNLHKQYMTRDTAGLLKSIQLYPFNRCISTAAIDFLIRIFHHKNSNSRDIVNKGGIAIIGKLITLNEKQWKNSKTIFLAVLLLWTFCRMCKESDINIIEMAQQNTIEFLMGVVKKSEDERVIEMGFDILHKLCYRSEHCQYQALLTNGIEVVACKIKNNCTNTNIIREACCLIGTMSCITMPPVNIANSSAIGVLVTYLRKNNTLTQKYIVSILLKLQKNKHNRARIARALGQSTIRNIIHNHHTDAQIRRKCVRLHKLVFKK